MTAMRVPTRPRRAPSIVFDDGPPPGFDPLAELVEIVRDRLTEVEGEAVEDGQERRPALRAVDHEPGCPTPRG